MVFGFRLGAIISGGGGVRAEKVRVKREGVEMGAERIRAERVGAERERLTMV